MPAGRRGADRRTDRRNGGRNRNRKRDCGHEHTAPASSMAAPGEAASTGAATPAAASTGPANAAAASDGAASVTVATTTAVQATVVDVPTAATRWLVNWGGPHSPLQSGRLRIQSQFSNSVIGGPSDRVQASADSSNAARARPDRWGAPRGATNATTTFVAAVPLRPPLMAGRGGWRRPEAYGSGFQATAYRPVQIFPAPPGPGQIDGRPPEGPQTQPQHSWRRFRRGSQQRTPAAAGGCKICGSECPHVRSGDPRDTLFSLFGSYLVLSGPVFGLGHRFGRRLGRICMASWGAV